MFLFVLESKQKPVNVKKWIINPRMDRADKGGSKHLW